MLNAENPVIHRAKPLVCGSKALYIPRGTTPLVGHRLVNERIQSMAKTSKTAELKPRTKSQILMEIAESTELSRKQVAGVFDAMGSLIKKDLGQRGPGMFTVPGLMKIKRINKPARPARKNVPNPFKPGEMMDVPAKPARKVVKVLPLKGLKEMV